MSSFFRAIKSGASKVVNGLYSSRHWNQIDRQAGVGTLQGLAYASIGAVAGGVAAQPEILGNAINNLLSKFYFLKIPNHQNLDNR